MGREGKVAQKSGTRKRGDVRVEDVMTRDPVCLPESAPVVEAARRMKGNDIGTVVVVGDDGSARGIVTDRDIVVRAVADGQDPTSTPIAEITSRELATLTPGEPADDAVQMMRDKAIRRMPVVEGNKVIGILSLGDLAQVKDPKSALAQISAAPPNE